MQVQAQVPAAASTVAALDEKLDVKIALQRTLKSAIIMDGVAKGLHEAAKALDKYNFETIFSILSFIYMYILVDNSKLS